jgi:HTH-type transcriptional regulator/antitoxin HigA
MLTKQNENEYGPLPLHHLIESIKLKMKERWLRDEELVAKIGSKGYWTALLDKRKPLTLGLDKLFPHEMKIPAEVLLSQLFPISTR